jgi:6-phosphogluconolactonase
VTVVGDPGALYDRAADRMASLIAAEVARAGGCSVALSGGSTPGPIHQRLAKAPLPWSALRFFFVDERCVPPDHPDSNFRLARETLFDLVPVPPEQVVRMEGEREDLEAAAEDYERRLPERLQVALLGMGEDGHFASVFPGSPLVRERTRLAAAVRDSPKPPPRRLTLTPAALRGAKILMVVCGAGKAQAVARALEGDEPAEVVPAHLWRDREWILDRAAASQLSGPERNEST